MLEFIVLLKPRGSGWIFDGLVAILKFFMRFSDCRLLRGFQTYVFIACGHLFWMVLCPDMCIQCPVAIYF